MFITCIVRQVGSYRNGENYICSYFRCLQLFLTNFLKLTYVSLFTIFKIQIILSYVDNWDAHVSTLNDTIVCVILCRQYYQNFLDLLLLVVAQIEAH